MITCKLTIAELSQGKSTPRKQLNSRRKGSARYYYHRDHLGSTRAVVTAAGSVTEVYDYMPFGEMMDGRITTSSGGAREKFTSHEFDDEVNLYYMHWRRYIPRFGVFTSVDPMASMYPGISPYAYVMNNPMNATDPDGRTVYYVNGELVYDDGEDNALVVHTTQDIIDGFTKDGETNWDRVRNDDRTTTEITDQDKYWEWVSDISNDIMAAFDGGVKVSADNKGNITYQTSAQAMFGMMGEAAVGMVGGYVLGKGLSMLVKTGSGGFKLVFGRDRNQAFHTFRHLHETGADGVKVMDAIAKDLKTRYGSLPVSQGRRFTVTVNGKTYQYSAFKNAKGEVNVGTIFEN